MPLDLLQADEEQRDPERGEWILEERDEGRGVLLVSLELEEVLSLSDRILVMYEGEIAGEFPPTATEEQLGVAMTGGGRTEERAA